MQTLQGGKFGHGFLSAGVTQAFSGKIDTLDAANRRFSPSRVIAAALVGGSVSAASGGKFANGAVTAAFSRAFNDEWHRPANGPGAPPPDPYGSDAVEDFLPTELEIKLFRFLTTNEATISEIYWEDLYGNFNSAFVLEPAGPSSTIEGSDLRIMPGSYELMPYSSRAYPSAFELQRVPGRSKILIHSGNTPAHTLGCLMPGSEYRSNRVYNSRAATKALYNSIRQQMTARIIISERFDGGFE